MMCQVLAYLQDFFNRRKAGGPHEQLRLMVTGGAGCGKTFVLKVVREFLEQQYEEPGWPGSRVAVMTPTGIAASLIPDAATYFMALGLIPAGPGRPFQYLKGEVQEPLTRFYKQRCRAVIFDEISMIGVAAMGQIDERLRRLRTAHEFDWGGQEIFGGLDTVMFGDFYQVWAWVCGFVLVFSSRPHHPYVPPKLPPVGDTVLALEAQLRECTAYIELKQNHRQEQENVFVTLLNQFRTGTFTPEQINRYFMPLKVSEPACAVPDDWIGLAGLKERVDQFNESTLQVLAAKGNDESWSEMRLSCSSPVNDRTLDSCLKSLRKESRIPLLLHLVTGMKVMLQVNLSVSEGLVNGAIGILWGWAVNPPEATASSATTVNIGGPYPVTTIDKTLRPPGVAISQAWVEFREGVGGSWRVPPPPEIAVRPGCPPQLVLIEEFTAPVQRGGSMAHIFFTQLPLRPAYAVTVHKVQGQSFSRVLMDLSRSQLFGGHAQIYVALSRLRSMAPDCLSFAALDGDALTTRKPSRLLREILASWAQQGQAQTK
ncbi:putative ATP-dependent DNA helicase PIF1 [Paratrimastix pyriformis]|uniref:ATP-dependent DNA helicase n=1 Tax=Paratrimastix pyriformis TaxID=342808 RepID=A0ABQ8U8P8_9EUKA|nr:putative ATP-dependent DNA helicase PIF1 [Paratrimastix pyriformis]